MNKKNRRKLAKKRKEVWIRDESGDRPYKVQKTVSKSNNSNSGKIAGGAILTGAAAGARQYAASSGSLLGAEMALNGGLMVPFYATPAGAAIATAVQVGAAAYAVGSAVSSFFSQNNSTEVIKQLIMPGTYQGKLNVGKLSKGVRDKYQAKGAVAINETYGSVTDTDLVWLGHSSFNLAAVADALGMAILRKLFKKAGFDVVNPYAELPLASTNDAIGYRIVYSITPNSGTASQINQDTANDNTLIGLVQAGGYLRDIMISMMTSANAGSLENVYLYGIDSQTVGVTYRLVASLIMSREIVEVSSVSHMVVQNRTKSAGGNSADTDQVDVQPLKGPVFEFYTGIPKTKSEYGNPLPINQALGEGLILARTSGLGGSDVAGFKEVPTRSTFNNVSRSSYTRLPVGALKSMTIGATLKGPFKHILLNKLRVSRDPDTGRIMSCPGKSQLVCLEEELNSGSAQKITVNYECQKTCGAQLFTGKAPNMLPIYGATNLNNLEP